MSDSQPERQIRIAAVGMTASRLLRRGHQQHRSLDACTGGQGTSPKEQKTQQSPGLGRSSSPQPSHVWKTVLVSTGISSRSAWPHVGQVRLERSLMAQR